MKNKKKLMESINALYLEVDVSIMEEVRARVVLALDEEYHRGIEDGKTIEKHGSVHWIT